jgi:hypothetical protein
LPHAPDAGHALERYAQLEPVHIPSLEPVDVPSAQRPDPMHQPHPLAAPHDAQSVCVPHDPAAGHCEGKYAHAGPRHMPSFDPPT